MNAEGEGQRQTGKEGIVATGSGRHGGEQQDNKISPGHYRTRTPSLTIKLPVHPLGCFTLTLAPPVLCAELISVTDRG